MSKVVPRDWKKWDMNSNPQPQSEVMCEGTPCLENMWRTKSCMRSLEVMVLCIRMNSDCLDNWSTMTRIDVYPEDEGSFSMKSMEIKFQGRSGTGNCFNSP